MHPYMNACKKEKLHYCPNLFQSQTAITRISERHVKIFSCVVPSLCGVSSPVTVLEWPRGFQEVKVPRFHDNGAGWW
jgi:hypothetical protein